MTKRQRDEVRLRNLELLVAEAGSAVNLARRAGTSESYLSQVRRGLPTAKGTARAVGDALAVKLEKAMSKPSGWMDESHPALRPPHVPDPRTRPRRPPYLPLLPWNLAPDGRRSATGSPGDGSSTQNRMKSGKKWRMP